MGLCYSRNDDKTSRTETGATSTATTTAERQSSGRCRKPRDLNTGGEIDETQQVVGRLVGNGSSKIACLHTQQGTKGTNQDAMLVWENFCSRSDTVFCGVYDGHGPFGHMVAKRVRDMLPFTLSTQLKTISETELSYSKNGLEPSTCIDGEQRCELKLSQKDLLPVMYPLLKRALLKTCQQMDKELKMHPTIDCFCSGTTSVTAIKQGKDLVVGNIGDSRAVLATRDQDNDLIAVQLTIDSLSLSLSLSLSQEKTPASCRIESKKITLAECISAKEDEEWSALEGLTRVNSLLSIPRFFSGDLRSSSWRKWLSQQISNSDTTNNH